jgi:hypothetical protein
MPLHEIMWVQTLQRELQVPSPSCAKVWVDNLGAKFLTFNPVFHGRMEHVEVDCHFNIEHVAKKFFMLIMFPQMIKLQTASPRLFQSEK